MQRTGTEIQRIAFLICARLSSQRKDTQRFGFASPLRRR